MLELPLGDDSLNENGGYGYILTMMEHVRN